jgi:glutamate synthase domain-containing protein 1
MMNYSSPITHYFSLMCGIVGFLDKTGTNRRIGQQMLPMMQALSSRGPDSTGIAIWGDGSDRWTLRVKLGEPEHIHNGVGSQRAREVLRAAETVAPVIDIDVQGVYARLTMQVDAAADTIINAIEEVAPEVEVVSLGLNLEIVKQVGSPELLEKTFCVSQMKGTHGIGHTRLSTESKIDLSHSQPFWGHVPDVATVHNGHITNYHKLRRIYEQRGVRFYTENDSEIIGIYLRDRMCMGDSFEEAIRASQRDFDGSYCYLAANESTFAYVKDGFGFKPLIVAETSEWVAVATEEIALRVGLQGNFKTVEPPAGSVKFWTVPSRIYAYR